MQVASFFSGIGGFDLGFERAGMQVVFQCEIDDFCQKILKRHWPHIPLHEDITKLTAAAIPSAELWCAGWPCQDLSSANTDRPGLQGKRSGLFYSFLELAAEVQPKWLVLENVPGLLSAEQGTALEAAIDALEEVGYLGGGYRVTLSIRAYPTTGTEYSLSQVLSRHVPIGSLLTAANCLGILRRENRAERKLDPVFVKSLSETLRLWYSVAVASGTPWQKASAPRYVPKLEAIKEAIQTDQYCVARNLTWTEWEKLMGFPPGWTVVEEGSLATPLFQELQSGLEEGL